MSAGDRTSGVLDRRDESGEKTPMSNQTEEASGNGRSKESDPWSELMVLSLDGNGVKALVELHVLKELMSEIETCEKNSNARCSWDSPLILPLEAEKESDLYLPCHYFDYVGGTSVGGLTAIMLGRLRMSVEEVIHAVQDLAKSVEAKPKRRKSFRKGWLLSKGTRDANRSAETDYLMSSLEPYLSERPIIPGLRFLPSKFSVLDEHMCKSVTFVNNHALPEPLKSYGTQASESLEIVEALRKALSNAAPRKISGNQGSKSSPVKGLSRNTELPSILIKEIDKNVREHPLHSRPPVGKNSSLGTHSVSSEPNVYLVSIGPEYFGNVPYRFFHAYIPEPLEVSKLLPKGWKLGCNEEKLKAIERETVLHCQSNKIRGKLRKYAQTLVDARQQRAQTRRWERFALGTQYNCNFCILAGTGPKYLGDQYGLIEHLQRVHDAPPPDALFYDDYMEILKNFRTGS